MVLADDVCRGVLASWERVNLGYNISFAGCEFTDTTYTVFQDEHNVLKRRFSSVQAWASGHELTPAVWRSYWIVRTTQNCLALAGALLLLLQSLAKKGLTHLKHADGGMLDLSTARLSELAIFPHKVGSVQQGMMDKTTIPKGGKGCVSWHCWVEIQSSSATYAMDIACGQFDVFGQEVQPFLILPASEHKQRICSSHNPHPSPGMVTHPLVQIKIASMTQDMLAFVKAAKTKPAERRMIPATCPFGPWIGEA